MPLDKMLNCGDWSQHWLVWDHGFISFFFAIDLKTANEENQREKYFQNQGCLKMVPSPSAFLKVQRKPERLYPLMQWFSAFLTL